MRRGLIIALGVFLLDQLSKYWILEIYRLPARMSVEILPFFSLTMVWNQGMSMGLFQASSDTARWVLVGLTSLVTVALVVWLRKAPHWWTQAALGLVIGGAIGNIVDRVRFGAVADFLHFYVGDKSFWVFNVADSAISVGVALLVFDTLIERKLGTGPQPR